MGGRSWDLGKILSKSGVSASAKRLRALSQFFHSSLPSFLLLCQLLCSCPMMAEISKNTPSINPTGSGVALRSVSRQSTTSTATEDWDVSQDEIKPQTPRSSLFLTEKDDNKTPVRNGRAASDATTTKRKSNGDGSGRGLYEFLNKLGKENVQKETSDKEVADLVADLGQWVKYFQHCWFDAFCSCDCLLFKKINSSSSPYECEDESKRDGSHA